MLLAFDEADAIPSVPLAVFTDNAALIEARMRNSGRRNMIEQMGAIVEVLTDRSEVSEPRVY